MNKAEVLERIKELGVLAVIRGPFGGIDRARWSRRWWRAVSRASRSPTARRTPKRWCDAQRRNSARRSSSAWAPSPRPNRRQRKAAGANFLVSPVCEPDLVRSMVASGLLTMAGALTPTEVLQAHRLGSDVVKVFPGSLGGPAYVKALKGPFPHIPMMPTGGVSSANVADWFAAGVVAVGAGSELCPPQLAKEGKFDEITQQAADFASGY